MRYKVHDKHVRHKVHDKHVRYKVHDKHVRYEVHDKQHERHDSTMGKLQKQEKIFQLFTEGRVSNGKPIEASYILIARWGQVY